MGLLYLLIAIVGEHAGKMFDKLNFRKTRIASRQLVLLIFLVMTVSLAAFIAITRQPFPHLTLAAAGLLALVVAISFAGNTLDYLSLKRNDLSLREPLSGFEPIAAGLVGYLLFPDERQPGFLLAFIAGAVITYWGTHRRHLRKTQQKGMSYFLIAVCLYSLLSSVYGLALEYLSPAYIAFFRVSAVLLLSLLFFPLPKRQRKFSARKLRYGFASGMFYAAATVGGMYAISELGVVVTMLLTLLGPCLSYTVSYFVLKENVHKGEMASSFLLAVVVILPMVR